MPIIVWNIPAIWIFSNRCSCTIYYFCIYPITVIAKFVSYDGGGFSFFIDCECCDDMFGFRVSGCNDCDDCDCCVVVSNECNDCDEHSGQYGGWIEFSDGYDGWMGFSDECDECDGISSILWLFSGSSDNPGSVSNDYCLFSADIDWLLNG